MFGRCLQCPVFTLEPSVQGLSGRSYCATCRYLHPDLSTRDNCLLACCQCPMPMATVPNLKDTSTTSCSNRTMPEHSNNEAATKAHFLSHTSTIYLRSLKCLCIKCPRTLTFIHLRDICDLPSRLVSPRCCQNSRGLTQGRAGVPIFIHI